MKLSNGYKYVVLCEDAQMKSFIVSFLISQDINTRRIYVKNYPCGRGCGEAFVKTSYPIEAKILRATNYIRTVLVVCADADNYSVEERERVLDSAVKDKITKWKRVDEPIILWIPKREIETWIACLRGEKVDESMSFKHSGKPVSCKKEAEMFSDYCQDLTNLDVGDIKSLVTAKEEYKRVCGIKK